MYYDGCLVGIDGTNSNKCLYGDPTANRTLILFGDSHAMQYFPPLEELADNEPLAPDRADQGRMHPGRGADPQHGRRPRVLAVRRLAGGHAAADRRRQSRDRRRGLMSGDTAYTPYGERRRGAERGRERAAAMEAGYVATLRRIHRCRPADGRDQGHPGLGQRRSRLRLRRPPEPRLLRLPSHSRQDQGIRRPRRAGGARHPPDRRHRRDLPRTTSAAR